MTEGCWKPARRKYGVAVCSFNSAIVLHSLPIQIGETVQIWEEYWAKPTEVTWLRGCLFNNKSKKGIFPASYVEAKECTVENPGAFEVVTPVEDAIIKELTFVLKEWHVRWKTLFVSRKALFQTILLVMGELAKFRSTLVSNTLTTEHAQELKHQVVTMIDWGNGQLGMDLVPRVDYQQADPENVSVVEMFRIHERSVKNCEGAWPGGMVKVKAREHRGEVIHHLLVGLCSFACSVGDNSEVLLSLYDAAEGRFISEKFVMFFNKDGQRSGNDRTNSTMFTDLSSGDMEKDIFLVLHILRKGRLTTEGNFKKVPLYQYRRPWGISVLSLRDLFQIKPENELEYFLRVHCLETEAFATMHETLIKKQTQLIGKSASDRQNQGVTLTVKILSGDLRTVRVEDPTLFTRGTVLTQRMGFPDYINPGEVRNDLYLTLCGAEFDRGNKTASKNVEVRVSVYNEKCEVIKDCILAANGEPMTSSFFSYVLYHSNSPKWNETIRLSIPIEKFSTAHIRVELCHCSNRDKAERKMYGFAYLSLITKENATRLDGKYDLCIYKCEDAAKIKNYLRLPQLKDDFNDPKVMPEIPSHIPYHHSNKEYITVETFLCSSKFAQKAELFNVLQWASKPGHMIPESLDKLLKLKGQELVRYLQDILDALFNMLSAGDGKMVPYAMQIYQALVHIFCLLHEDMFEKFSVVLDDYLEKSFSSPLAHRDLMLCLRKYAEMVYTCTDFDDKGTKKAFKTLEDVFKFSVRSCILSQRMYSGQLEAEFRENLNKVFEAFGKIVSSQEKVLHKHQAQLLNNLHKTYIPLLHIMTNTELAQLVMFVLTRINKEPGNSVLKAKTVVIQNTINSPLMQDPKSRTMLLPQILSHLKKCLVQRRHLDVTANTLGDLLTTMYQLKENPVTQGDPTRHSEIKEEVTRIIQGVFDVTVRTLWELSPDQCHQAGNLLVACLTEMLRLMDVNHYKKLIGDYPKPKPLRDFLNRVILVFHKLVSSDDFPPDWISMRMIISNVMLTAIQYIAADLTDNFLEGADFDKEVWYNFFILAVAFITQPALQLEKYSEAKRGQIKTKYNDMRVPVGFHISSLWNQLGSNKQHLMMDMIGPFLKVTMVPELELRKATIPIFYDIMQCEYGIKQHLKRVEAKMIYELDSLVIEHHGDVDYKKLFESILLDKVQAEPELQEEGKRFIFSVTDLLERLLNYRDIMDREEQRDTKMHCTFNILNYYKDSRRDMYIRYISRLYELHYSAGNYVEAGLTLRLYAQLLSWSTTIMNAEMNYKSQTEAERKEELFMKIMDCFDKGKAWEYGLPLCKELGAHYEKTFQYKKLGQILQKQASFLYQILEGQKLRQDPTYYRVSYIGNTFPTYLKNKAFIYRGDECLKLATIMHQLTTEYPQATILTTSSPPAESYKHGDSQFIQIVSVKPIPSERPEFVGQDVPSEISIFYNTNEVDTFQFDRPYYRNDKDKENEFKSLCLERTIIKTSYKLPGILRWYEVTETRVVHFCPVQTAIDTVEQMNAELKSSADNAWRDPDQCLRHMEMRLQGVISGAVNGGIPKYQEAFFNDEYKSKYPDETVYIDKLKSVILEQIQLLERGLAIHGKYASTEMQPLHRSLVETFSKMKNSMGYQNVSSKHRGSSISNGSSNRPSTPSSMSINSSGSNRSSVISGGGDGNCVEEDNIYMDPAESMLPSYDQSNIASGLNDTDLAAPPPPPPRKKSVPDISSAGLPSTILPSPTQQAAPPIPIRKQSSRASIFPELDKQRTTSVSRSDSNRSDVSDTSTPPRPPRTTGLSPVTPTSPLDAGGAKPDIPPLPVKRQSVMPVNKSFGGSNTSLNSTPGAGYNNFSRSTSVTTNNNDVNTNNLNQHHLKHASTEPTMTSAADRPPPLVARSPSNRETPPPPPPARSPSNRDTIGPLPSREAPPIPEGTITSASEPPPNRGAPPPIPKRKPSTTS